MMQLLVFLQSIHCQTTVLVAGNNFKLDGLFFTCPGGSGVTTTRFPDGTQGYMFKVDTKVSDTAFTANVGGSNIQHTYTAGTGFVRTGVNTDIFPDPNQVPLVIKDLSLM